MKTFAFYAFTVLSLILAPIHALLLACSLVQRSADVRLLPVTYRSGPFSTIDLFILHLAFPALLEVVQPDISLRVLLRSWLLAVLPHLGLQSLLPGAQIPSASGPKYWTSIFVAVLFGWATLALVGFLALLLPLVFGALLPRILSHRFGDLNVDFFHWMAGIVITILAFNLITKLTSALRQQHLLSSAIHVTRLTARAAPVALLLHGIIPILLGRVMEKIIITPESITGVTVEIPTWQVCALVANLVPSETHTPLLGLSSRTSFVSNYHQNCDSGRCFE